MEILICDILSYTVMLGFEFAALCAITRIGRGWLLQALGLAALTGADVLLEWWYRVATVTLDASLAMGFCTEASVFLALVLALSRDSFGRRLFLAIDYLAYAACYVPVFHLFAYRNILGLPPFGACLAGLAFVSAANLVFLFWILPWVPRSGFDSRWRGECLAVGVLAALLFVCGIWPISIVTAPARYCAAFVFASAVAWTAFPLLLRSLHERRRQTALEHSLALLTAEAKLRRAAIDEARRIRHDQHHHLACLADHLRAGRYGKALGYLEALNRINAAVPLERLVWCPNETVNAILSSCAGLAAAKGVKVVAKVDIRGALVIRDVELVAVLANLLENAVRGAEGVRSKEPGASMEEVSVTIRQRGYGLGIRVVNPVPEGFRLSAKGLPCAVPGLGMESVRQVVERYHGSWTYTLRRNLIDCQVALYYL